MLETALLTVLGTFGLLLILKGAQQIHKSHKNEDCIIKRTQNEHKD
jgi:hypothetical protein